MNEILDNMYGLIEPYQTWIAVGLLIASFLAVGGYVLIPKFGRLALRIVKKQSRAHQQAHISLLSNEAVVELYSPAQRHIYHLAEGEKRKRTNAWLSPYARAVKATVKAQGRIPKSQAFNAKRQIKEVAKHVKVRALNAQERDVIATFEGDDETNQFIIELAYNGKDPAAVKKVLPAVKTQLGLEILESQPTTSPMGIKLLASKSKLDDALVRLKPAAEFFEDNPAKSPLSLPMAMTASRKVWCLPTHHTFIYGTTGSGKSGPLLAMVKQLVPFIGNGTVKLYGIDPKRMDLAQFADTNLFEEVAFTAPEAIDVICEVYAAMNKRIDSGVKSGKPTTSLPMTVLMVDELFTLKKRLYRSKEGKAAWAYLEEVMAMGRSEHFYIVAASQLADKANLEDMRGNFQNLIVLRQESAYLNDLFLGDKAAERGFNSTAIPASNPANGYRYSGIGFVLEEGGEPVKIRVAYLSKEDLGYLVAEHKRAAIPKASIAEPEPEEESWFFDIDDD